jgi:hypothetical protein
LFKPLFPSIIFLSFHCIPSTTTQPLSHVFSTIPLYSMKSLYSINHNSASFTHFYSFHFPFPSMNHKSAIFGSPS